MTQTTESCHGQYWPLSYNLLTQLSSASFNINIKDLNEYFRKIIVEVDILIYAYTYIAAVNIIHARNEKNLNRRTEF